MSESGSQGKGNMSLSQTNPEVFTAEPRPGGYVKMPKTFADDSSSSDTTSNISRVGSSGSKCICKSTNAPEAADDSGVITPSYILLRKLTQVKESPNPCEPSRECSPEDTANQPLDTKSQFSKLLSVTISSVMLLATQADVSLDSLKIAESYLDCMTDENGDYPPNIEGILQKICALIKSKSPTEDEPPRKLETGTICEKRVEFRKTECPKKRSVAHKVSRTEKYSHKK